ncbi:MAG: hypothetical protein HOW73_03590 [Polyangiaceae bacterium]|nr:hypothetical protein [Polyangiaceae bacterium]
MLPPDLAAHLARAHSLEAFDAWVSELSQWGQVVQATAACAAAGVTLSAWVSYDAPDAVEWHRGRAVPKVASCLETWLASHASPPPELSASTDQLGAELERMSFYVYEASGSAMECGRRDRALAAAGSIYSAARSILWTPSLVPSFFDSSEQSARVLAGPLDETVDACRKAAFATGGGEGVATVAARVRKEIMRRFAP